MLEKLDSFDDVVVTFKLVRERVQKIYYIFCTPECTKHIICMLKERINTREYYNENNRNTPRYIGFYDKLILLIKITNL